MVYTVYTCKRVLTHSCTLCTIKLMHASYMSFFVLKIIANTIQSTIKRINLHLQEFMPCTHQNQQRTIRECEQTLSLQIMHS